VCRCEISRVITVEISVVCIVVHYETIKEELQTRPTKTCRVIRRCDERLKTKTEESTRLVYTGFLGELEHLKIKTRLIDERFPSVMVECCLL
jgi:hypothetical protein